MGRAPDSGIEIRHEEQGERGAFFVEDEGARLAELSYTRTSPKRVVIEHTEVSDVLRGRGVGQLLVERAVDWARGSATKLFPVCPYAKTVFERHSRLRDVLE